MNRKRRLKIVATLGPRTSNVEMIERLFKAGADVFRINMSHTSHEDFLKLKNAVRKVENNHARPIGILVDLQGPKLRISEMPEDGILLKEGAKFTFDKRSIPGDAKRVCLPHNQIFDSIKRGHQILLDDGRMALKTTKVTKDEITAKVVIGGILTSRKGVSLPDTLLPISALTKKDRSDLKFTIDHDIDWIALSFVQRADDIKKAAKLIDGKAAIMAKIEKPSAIEELDEIISLSDGIMVARGDLGVELPLQMVPGLQKKITRKSRLAGKPVVIATQMLETMISSPTPTRAEVSDIATAVFDGADAVMLSAESAVGDYPIESIATMDKIALEVQQDKGYEALLRAIPTKPESTGADAIAAAAHSIARTLDLAAIICYTATGSTSLRVARERPNQVVLALTPVVATARRLALVWGVHCVLTDNPVDLDDVVEKAARIAAQEGYAKKGERIIITAGVPLGTAGATNMVRIAYIGGRPAGT